MTESGDMPSEDRYEAFRPIRVRVRVRVRAKTDTKPLGHASQRVEWSQDPKSVCPYRERS